MKSVSILLILFVFVSCSPKEDSSGESQDNEIVQKEQLSSAAESEPTQSTPSVPVTPFNIVHGFGVGKLDIRSGAALEFYQMGPDGILSEPSVIVEIQMEDELVAALHTDHSIQPEFFMNLPEYDLFEVLCHSTEPDEGYYLVEYAPGMNYYLQEDRLEFFSWEDYLKAAPLGCGRKDGTVNPLREKPSEQAKIIDESNLNIEHTIVVMEMKDEWVRVEVIDGVCGGEEIVLTGWIKWRTTTDHLLNIFYIC